MRLERLCVEGLRNLAPVELRPGPALNLIVGPNGAGKSSLLEAIHLLAYGRSFRGRVREGLIQIGLEAVEVFAEWSEPSAISRRVGLRHAGQTWTGRLDGRPVTQLNELCAALAVLTFEPGSHHLVQGAAEHRRRYLDWALFHVELDFMGVWRRYARALKQRNALLKQRAGTAELDVWDAELAAAAGFLDAGRRAYVERLQSKIDALSQELLPQLGPARISYTPGWRSNDVSLPDALLLSRPRDLALGFTSVGPHRADWRLQHTARANDELLSRGQAKLAALACLLAQAQDFAHVRAQWPIVLLDDIASELDQQNQRRLLERLSSNGAQVFLTGAEAPPALRANDTTIERFALDRGVLIRS